MNDLFISVRLVMILLMAYLDKQLKIKRVFYEVRSFGNYKTWIVKGVIYF